MLVDEVEVRVIDDVTGEINMYREIYRGESLRQFYCNSLHFVAMRYLASRIDR